MKTWIKRIEDAEWVPNKDEAEKQSKMLMDQVNNSKEFKKELFSAIALPMVQEFVDGANAMIEFNAGVLKEKSATTTAQEAAIKYDIDLGEVLGYIEGFDVALQWPDWMIEEALKGLADTISRPYWDAINETFTDRAATLLKDGIEQGWSIPRIAKGLREASGSPDDQWIKTRSKNIARTETGNMQSAGARSSIDKLNEETGLNFRAEWSSVLGSTSRPSHMELHGVIADENGMFNLDGVLIPWPSHPDLPAANRCNCACAIFSALPNE